METKVIIGPPGTGKTTWLIQKAADAAEKFGHSKVLVASLTKAAATEAGARAVNVDRSWAKNQIKTLHAHAYAAIGHDQKVVSAKHIAAWNEDAPSMLRLSGAPKDTDDFSKVAPKALGDKLLEAYTLARSRLIPPESLPNPAIADFAKRWEAFKREHELIDFEDMIQLAYERTTAAPGNPSVIYLDEAQDHSAAEIRLAEHWGKAAGNLVVVGDPDQVLFQWRGADPKVFSNLISADRSNLRVLEQSYRVPRQVHQRAVGVISGCTGREQVEYRPRDATGAVLRSHATYKRADQIVSLAATEADAGRSVMILGTCSYHLAPTLAVLKKRGIPFHNHFRRKRGDWNPLASMDRVHNYLRPQARFWGHNAGAWTWGQLWSWLELVPASYLQSGAKASVQRLAKDKDWKDRPMAASPQDAVREVSEYFRAGAPQWYDESDPLTFMRVCRLKDQRRMRYLLSMACKHPDIATGKEEPKLVVGTVHSVKGGQADTVIFFPDLSKQAIDSGDINAARRVYYVAYTRAREKLVVCNWAWCRNRPSWTLSL